MGTKCRGWLPSGRAWPWVLQPPGSPQRARFEAMIREAGIHTRLDITETSSTIATTALLEASDMAAVMPDSLARHYGRLGILQEKNDSKQYNHQGK